MSNNNGTDTAEMLAWVAEVNGIAALAGRPIEGLSDPRYIAMVEKWGVEKLEYISEGDNASMGKLYFEQFATTLLPVPPIERPDWARSHRLTVDDYPYTVGIEFMGTEWETGSGDPNAEGPEASAQVTWFANIAVQDFSDEERLGVDAEPWRAGDVRPDALTVSIRYQEGTVKESYKEQVGNITVNSARALAIALGDAVAHLPFD